MFMFCSVNTDDALTRLQDEALAELLELGMAAARECQAKLMAAEDARALADCALALGRASRSVRQTIALQVKVGRARRTQGREDAADGRREAEARASRRKAQAKATVERLIWTEAEGGEAERLIDHLDDLVSEDALYDGFADGPVEAYIARICADLGLPVPEFMGRLSPEGPQSAPGPAPPTGDAGGSPPPIRDSGPQDGETFWRSSA